MLLHISKHGSILLQSGCLLENPGFLLGNPIEELDSDMKFDA